MKFNFLQGLKVSDFKTVPHVYIPLSIMKYLQGETLSQTESKLIIYILEKSLNFANFQSGQRHWVAISPSMLTIERAQANRALKRLSTMEIFDVKTEKAHTLGGLQMIRYFRVADEEKINHANLSIAIGKNSIIKLDKVYTSEPTPFAYAKSEGVGESAYTTMSRAPTPRCRERLHRRCESAYTFYEISLKFHKVKNPKECIKNIINKFLISLPTHDYSFRTMLVEAKATQRTIRSFELFLSEIKRDRGDFYTFALVIAWLEFESSDFADFEGLKRFYKNVFLKKYHDKFTQHSQGLTEEIAKLYYEFEEIKKNSIFDNADFETNAQFYFNKMRLDQGSSIFLFVDGLDADAINAFKSSWGIDQFTKEILKHFRIYFLTKVFGERWLYAIELMNGEN